MVKKTISNTFVVNSVDDPVSLVAQYSPTNTPESYEIHTTFQSGDKYMRTRTTEETFSGNVDPDHPWNRLVGESGGETDYKFNISKEKTSANSTTPPSNCYYGEWQDAPSATTSTYPYLWEKVQKKDGAGNNIGSASYVRLTGEEGKDAEWYEIDTESVDSIVKNGTSYTPSAIKIRCYRHVGGSKEVIDPKSYSGFFRVYKDTTSGNVYKYSDESTWSYDVSFYAPSQYLYIILYINSESNIIASKRIPIVKDGEDGEDGRDGTNGTDGEDGVSYCIVFTKAAARVDENNIVTAELAGYAYKYVGGVRSALASTTIRHGYILTDSDTYDTTTTNGIGFFDAGTWFNGDYITEYGKNSPSIFAAIVIDGTVVHAEMITISVKGGTGNRGKIGRFFYYAQEWSNSDTVSYTVSDAEAPYFLYNNKYWVFNPTTNGTYTMSEMGTPSSSSANWKLMTSDFKYIITEAIFGEYAHFGSFIINGDWLLSTNGKVGESVVSGESNISGSVIGGSSFSVKAVTLFDSAYPSDGMVDIAYENGTVTISTSETTKQILTVYLSSSLTYRVSCDYSRSSGGSFYVRIRHASYGSVVPIYLANTSGSSSGNFRVTTSGTYIVEIYTTSTGYTASVWNTSVSRLLFAPMYAVDGKTGASYQGGNGVFLGFVRKQKTRITTSNINQYKRTDITSATVLDFDKCGSFIELATGTYGYITLPLMSNYLASRYTSKQIDDIRSFVGTTMLIYNKSGRDIPMTLRYNSDGATTSGTLHNGNCVELECCLDADTNDGKEIIYWKVISYAEPVD